MIEPRLITFDFGDTLVTSDPSYLERTSIGLTEIGYPRTVDEVMEAYFYADILTAEKLTLELPFTNERFKEVFGENFFSEIGLLDEAMEVGPKLMDMLNKLKTERVLMPGAMELLNKLHDAGYPMGIISNNDGFTRKKCEAVGIDGYFLFILDSTLEDVMKPDPRFFLKAMQMGGVTPFEVMHVGDLWGCDIIGAGAAGITSSVWLSNRFVDPDPVEGVLRIGKLLDLLDIIKP
jgi:HAD superfamily hydrolase (TIGR01549 family)